MLERLWLLPALPFAGFLSLVVLGARLGRRAVATIGAGSVGLSAAFALALFVELLSLRPEDRLFTRVLYTWVDALDFNPEIAFTLDPLSMVLSLVVTGVGFLIHLYAAEFMHREAGYSRFFAAMNLFVGAMLVLVLADDLLLLYLGWEGVGLSSYLLIGFWYQNPDNGRAARKAFIVTRAGDTALLLGLLLIATELGTLRIPEVMARASVEWEPGSSIAVAAAALLLGGALGKSAQLPLHVWLPDAMAGPTPVSALIHAATMVTAGVYLIARLHVLFLLAPSVLGLVALLGTATLLLGGLSALAQRDIKRALAYSTISQIGYMFLALGVGAFSAAVLHLFTHAFFKAVLFLAAGAVILSLRHEHDLLAMGGLRNRLRLPFFAFLAGGASLAGFPLVTAGFYSKDAILLHVFSSPLGGRGLWALALLGAFITAVYTFRLVFLVFYGEIRTAPEKGYGPLMRLSIIPLAVLSLVAGFLEIPPLLGGIPLFSRFLRPAVPASPAVHEPLATEALLQAAAALVPLAGILVAYLAFLRYRRPDAMLPLFPRSVSGLLRGGFGFDAAYARLLVRPLARLSRALRQDPFDDVFRAVGLGVESLHLALSRTQSGRLRTYLSGIAAGIVVLVAVMVLS